MAIRPISKTASSVSAETDAAAEKTTAPEGDRMVAPPVRRRVRPVQHPAEREKLSVPSVEGHPSAAPEACDYDVGFCKPPKDGQFKKGKSGNPRGRPKGAKGLKAIGRALLLEKVTVRTGGSQKKVARIEALVMKQIEQALKGDAKAMQALTALYTLAVPETPAADSQTQHPALSETDEAILAEFAAQVLENRGDSQ
jgi:hypothetical protein